MKRKAIVFGATGKTGVQICKQLQTQNIPYSVFVREESISKLGDSEATVVKGNVMNPNDVKDALKEGSYTDVIISLGSKSLKADPVRSKGTENIVRAIKDSKVDSSIHVISALGVGDSWSQLNWFGKLMTNVMLKSVMRDHALQEDVVAFSECKYHILRPVGLKDGNPKGVVHVQAEGQPPSQAIQRADVAKYLVDSLVEGKEGFSSISEEK